MANNEPYVYKDLNEVPEKWRSHKGARLNLIQINAIIADAYSNQLDKGGISIPDYGGAKARFEESNVIMGNFWVTKLK